MAGVGIEGVRGGRDGVEVREDLGSRTTRKPGKNALLNACLNPTQLGISNAVFVLLCMCMDIDQEQDEPPIGILPDGQHALLK